MVKAIFLFPGQGAQYPGMALDLLAAVPAVRRLFDLASAASGLDMEKTLAEADAERLKRTDLSQVAVTLANLAAAAALRERGVGPAACAGFSLGEYAALAVAGVVAEAECFRLVAARGKAMQAAADALAAEGAPGMATPPGMAAVLGLPPDRVEALVAAWAAEGLEGLYAANFNSASQTVVAGTAAALDAAEARFKEAGAKRVVRLKVAGPFHSPLVASAARAFAPDLAAAPFADPALPLYSNVTGKAVASGAEAKDLLLRQIVEPVRWTAELGSIAAGLPLPAVEAGPGKVLQGLWKDAAMAEPCFAAGTLNDIEAAAAALARA